MTTTRLPKKIYTYWEQGRAEAPPIVELIFSRWEALNPDWDVIVLDRNTAKMLMPGGLPNAPLPSVQAYSDMLRVTILGLYGGVWVDATLYPVVPLEDWLGRIMQKQDFFAFSRPARDRLISSWFLAADRSSDLLRSWRENCRDFWSVERVMRVDENEKYLIFDDPIGVISQDMADVATPDLPAGQYPYFWFHYLFEYTIRQARELAPDWHMSEKLPAGPVHRLQRVMRSEKELDLANLGTYLSEAPVQKLDWRLEYSDDLLSRLREYEAPIPETI